MKPRSAIATLLSLLLVAGCSKFESDLPQAAQNKEAAIVFQNATLVPLTDEKIVENQTVVIKGGRIAAIGPAGTLDLPKGARRIDAAGAYLMPGLADMHMHTRDDWNAWHGDWPVSPLSLYLANGVTTVRCFGPGGDSTGYVLRWRDKIEKGRLVGPTIYTCGPILYGPVDNPRQKVLEQKARGFDFIKLYSFLSRPEFYAAMAAASQSGMYTAGHIPFQVGLDGVLAEGMREIAHIEELIWELVEFDREKALKGRKWMGYVIQMAYQQFKDIDAGPGMQTFEKMIEEAISSIAGKIHAAGVPVCTTLFLDEVIVEKLHSPEKFLAKPENRYLPRSYIRALVQGREKHQMQFRGDKDFAAFKRGLDLMLLKYLKRAGVKFVLGTDAGTGGMGLACGFSIHDELRILTENGFSPYEAIKTGTVNAAQVAERMNGNGDFGTLEVGKKADLILLDNNPLEDIANIKSILGVMASGRWFEKTMLQEFID